MVPLAVDAGGEIAEGEVELDSKISNVACQATALSPTVKITYEG
ncbi:hypothetical protein [Glutamicibacter uratoxydans]